MYCERELSGKKGLSKEPTTLNIIVPKIAFMRRKV
jgi:hypothetical protein